MPHARDARRKAVGGFRVGHHQKATAFPFEGLHVVLGLGTLPECPRLYVQRFTENIEALIDF